MTPLPRNQILVGDAAQTIATLPDASVAMVITSPPYFRVRNYGQEDQLGMEPTVDGWVDELQLVMRGLRRILKPTGTVWLNVADSYSTHAREGAPRKSLLLGPERLALRLVQDGWVSRNRVAWRKPNGMPSSVRDRLTCSWEYVFVFALQPRYYFDLDAIKVPQISKATKPKAGRARARADATWRGPNAASTSGLDRLHVEGRVGSKDGMKNPGDVWTIANPGYRSGDGEHHAVFPLELARRAILAGCPPGGVVLDPFMGAGTTAVAAEALGRDWLGIELHPDYARLAERRLQQARASPAA